jgi:hypothetical protein
VVECANFPIEVIVMQRKRLLFGVAVLLLASPVLHAEAKITAFYDKNTKDQKLLFRCIAKGMEAGKKYIVAVGTSAPITVQGSIELPEGAKVGQEPQSYVEKDINRINPALKELNSQGYRLNVQELAPEAEVKYRFELSYADVEKLKASNSPIYLYISREYSPNVYYIVDYYEMAPSSLVK